MNASFDVEYATTRYIVIKAQLLTFHSKEKGGLLRSTFYY